MVETLFPSARSSENDEKKSMFRLCAALHDETLPSKTYDKFTDWWDTQSACIFSPKIFVKLIHYCVNTYCIIKYIFTLTVWKQNEYGNIVENHNQMLLQEEYKACKQSIILSNKMTEVN